MYNDFGPSGGFDFMFTIVPIIIAAGFLFVFGTIIYSAVNTAKDKTKPVIPVKAKIVNKRAHVWGDHSHTSYYATFELENGERMELAIPQDKSGYLVEGDTGTLSFQGNLFVSFERS